MSMFLPLIYFLSFIIEVFCRPIKKILKNIFEGAFKNLYKTHFSNTFEN